MSQGELLAIDLVAVLVLAFGLYFPRYRRRDMVVALLGVNIGVMAVATALATAEITAGLGLGLFGVLSIIRIRSETLTQPDVVFYFAAITMGILGGIAIEPAWSTPALMGALLAALYIGDHPMIFAGAEQHTMVLDEAYTDRDALLTRLEAELDARVKRVDIKRVDMVKGTTTIDVRYKRG
ncbi:MAG: DUF4956 domain-containing protein [Acidimicrobiales bacterium]|nr:DUF4956 domain-containing protein [Acidimicrobiales bacterium]